MRLSVLILSFLIVAGCSAEKGQKNFTASTSLAGVIGGTEVQKTDAMAGFTVGIYDQKNDYICTGSLISETQVLTAAHCVETIAANIFVVFDLNFKAVDSKNMSVLRKAKSVRVHENYIDSEDAILDTNDIAVIEFEGALPEGYQPIEFLKDQSFLKRGTGVQVAGFGANKVIEEEVTKRDRKFKKDLASGDVICNDDELTYCFSLDFLGAETLRMTSVNIQGFTEKEIRLSETKGHGTCVGDSGGPLLFQLEGRFYLVGVTSRGSIFCDGPAIYTNALEYLDWIHGKSLK